MRVVLLGDPGEQLEARAAVLVAVLHADLGEHAGHGLGADAAVDRGDRAVAARRRPRRGLSLLAGAAGEQAGAGQLLDADGQAHVALAGLDRHDRRAQRRGAGGAGVGHVVDGDAGLADLLLQLLADAARRHPSGCRRRARPCPAIVTPPSASAPMAASAARSTVSLSGCLPNLVMWIPRIQMSSLMSSGRPVSLSPTGSNPKPMASVPASSVADRVGGEPHLHAERARARGRARR